MPALWEDGQEIVPAARLLTHPMPITQHKTELEQQLSARRRLQPIPPAWRDAFERQRLAEFSRLVSLWSPLLVLAYLACAGFT